MTFHSLFVRALPPNDVIQHFGAPDFDGEIVEDLAQQARHFNCSRVRQWADANALECFYVDSCWIRVPVTGTQLRTFYVDVLGTDFPEELAEPESRRFMIEAEEF